MGVLERRIFSHTPDEAMSVALAKACVPKKIWFCSREIKFLNEHWYNDIAAKELSVQIDENDNHITVTEDAVLDGHCKRKILAKTN